MQILFQIEGADPACEHSSTPSACEQSIDPIPACLLALSYMHAEGHIEPNHPPCVSLRPRGEIPNPMN